MAETKKSEKVVVELISAIRYLKKRYEVGTLIKIDKAIAGEWLKEGIAKPYDEKKFVIVEL